MDSRMIDLSGTVVWNTVDMLDKLMSFAKSEAFCSAWLQSKVFRGKTRKVLPVCMRGQLARPQGVLIFSWVAVLTEVEVGAATLPPIKERLNH